MPDKPKQFRPPGMKSKKAARAVYGKKRKSARKRGYTASWDAAAKAHRAGEPLCQYCLKLDGRVTAAALVDHLYPHKGNMRLFWDRIFWISSCRNCHDVMKQAVERQGLHALDALAKKMGKPTLAKHHEKHLRYLSCVLG